jgi:hypothetical protein
VTFSDDVDNGDTKNLRKMLGFSPLECMSKIRVSSAINGISSLDKCWSADSAQYQTRRDIPRMSPKIATKGNLRKIWSCNLEKAREHRKQKLHSKVDIAETVGLLE